MASLVTRLEAWRDERIRMAQTTTGTGEIPDQVRKRCIADAAAVDFIIGRSALYDAVVEDARRLRREVDALRAETRYRSPAVERVQIEAQIRSDEDEVLGNKTGG